MDSATAIARLGAQFATLFCTQIKQFQSCVRCRTNEILKQFGFSLQRTTAPSSFPASRLVTSHDSGQHSQETLPPTAESSIRPSRRFSPGLVLFAIALGVFAGIGTFTFGYGNGASYLSNNPQTCANCHVMQEHVETWQHSSHHHVAVCNDCHLPHDGIGKWVTKADNGFFHSLAFTLGDYPDPIQIKDRNRTVTQNACISCHKDFVHSLLPAGISAETKKAMDGEVASCVHCHADVGHAFHAFATGSKRE